MKVEKISYETLKKYWIEVDHFQDSNKRYSQHIYTLGPYKTLFKNPKSICYGLFADRLIGATQLVQWDHRVRYRTINIRPEYRGQDLGWHLLKTAWNDWQAFDTMIGWIRKSHYNWSIQHGFKQVSYWEDNHVMMERNMEDV